MAITGTLLAVQDYWGTEEAWFIVEQEIDLDKIVHQTDFSYAAHIHDGNLDAAWEFIAQLHVLEIKSRRHKEPT